MPRKIPVNDLFQRRIDKWIDEDPSSLLTRQVERATAPLHQLVALLLPNLLIKEVVDKTLWAAEVLTDRDDILDSLKAGSVEEIKTAKVDRCDALADGVHAWAIGAAAALGAWDLVGPLGTAPALVSLFTLSFRTIKKIGLCYGYATDSHFENLIVLEIFASASSLYHRDKVQAIKTIETLMRQPTVDLTNLSKEAVEATIERLSHNLSSNLTRRRSLSSVPAMGALVGGSTNAWLLKDVGWAARNIYALRRIHEDKMRETATKQSEEVILPKAA
ncbi:MAG: EcsC family protein [Bdellovibrionota bacterium]